MTNILLIDDLENTLKIIKDYLYTIFKEGENIMVYSYCVKIDKGQDMKDAKKKAQNDLIHIINNNNIHFIVADRGFYEQKTLSEEEKKTYSQYGFIFSNYNEEAALIKKRRFNVDDLLIGKDSIFSLIAPEKKALIQQVIIRTYNKNLFYGETHEIEKAINEELGKEDICFLMETSQTFVKPYVNEALYCGYEDDLDCYLLHNESRKEYELNFAYLLGRIIHEEINRVSDKKISAEYQIIESIKASINSMRMGKIKKIRDDKDFKLGQLTYISDILSPSPKHIIDIPYKQYYDKMNKKLEEEFDWFASLYKDEKDEYMVDKYFFYDFNVGNGIIELYNFFSNITSKEKCEKFVEFLPYLYASVFYDESYDTLKVRNTEKIKDKQSIKILFCFGRLNNKEFGEAFKSYKSVLSYSFWKIDDNEYSEDGIEEIYHIFFDDYYPNIKGIVDSPLINPLVREVEEIVRLRTFQNEVLAQHHSIKNIKVAVNSSVDNLKDYLKQQNELGKYYSVKIPFAVFCNCVFALLKQEQNIEIFLEHDTIKNEEVTIRDLLYHFQFYFQKCTSGRQFELVIEESISFEVIQLGKLANYYTLFYNILDNANNATIYGGFKGWKAYVFQEGGNVFLQVSNNRIIPNKNIIYLTDFSIQENEFTHKGTGIIRLCMELLKLPAPIIDINRETEWTHFKIQLNP
jgi:hypothetical protein